VLEVLFRSATMSGKDACNDGVGNMLEGGPEAGGNAGGDETEGGGRG
jgi:hypothetical protein